MSNTSDFVIQDRMLGTHVLDRNALEKYTGEDKDVVIPDGVIIIGREVFAGNKKMRSVTVPDSVKVIESSAFEKCSALKSVFLHAGALSIRDNVFKGCSKLTMLKGIGVTNMGDIFGLSKKNEVVMPLIFPNVSLSKAKNVFYKISLTMGYVLEPESYKGKGLAGYKKFLEENRELILETATRHGINSVVARLTANGEVQETAAAEEPVGVDQMSVATAKELFDIQSKTSGVKILWYKGNETVVDIPRVIGKTTVALVSPDAFSNDKIVRCNAKTFEKLSPSVQFNTYQAFLSGKVKFSAEQVAAMKNYFPKKQVKLLEAAVELQRADMLSILLAMEKLRLDEYTVLTEKAATIGNPEITAAVTTAKNAAYSQEDIESAETIAAEKALGVREMSLKDYQEIFKLTKRKDYLTNECWVLIRGCKKPQPYAEVPGTIEGMPVHLDRSAFNGDKVLEELVLGNGVIKIDMDALENCPNLKTVHIPASVCEIERDTMGSNNLLEIHVSPENTNYATQNGILYSKDFSVLLRCPAGKQGSVELPDGLVEIKNFAFSFCKNLSKLVIPATVKEISTNAFSWAGKDEWTGMEYATIWPFTIHAPAGSYAETYAKENNIPFVAE